LPSVRESAKSWCGVPLEAHSESGVMRCWAATVVARAPRACNVPQDVAQFASFWTSAMRPSETRLTHTNTHLAMWSTLLSIVAKAGIHAETESKDSRDAVRHGASSCGTLALRSN